MTPYSNISLAELAVRDPIAAYGRLLGIKAGPICMNSKACFSSFTLNQQPIVQPLDQIVAKRTWWDNVTFTLELPNVYSGNIFMPDALASLKASPGVSVMLTVMSGPRYVVSPTFTPIANFVNLINSAWTTGWQIAPYQQIQTQFMLTQIPLGMSGGTPPYIVTLTFNGWQFDDGCCDTITNEFAIAELAAAGVIKFVDVKGRRIIMVN